MKNILLLITVLLIFSSIFIISDGLFDDNLKDSNAYGIVYGNKIDLNGEPSNRLKSRLDISKNLYNNKKIGKIIVSGGIGKEGFDEAEKMAEYLIKKGIPEHDIIIDSNGYTTDDTSQNAYLIISEISENIDEVSVVGISQYFHISRVKVSLKNNGFTHVYGLAPKYFEVRDIYSILREIPAYIKYVLIK